MSWLSLIVVVVIIILVVVLKLRHKLTPTENFPYTKKKMLFSPAERSFLGVLDLVVGDEYRVFGKVRISDVVSVKSMSDRSVWQRAFNRISAKHFDFVLCRNDDLTISAVVELDDKSHQAKKRKGRDAFIVGLCDAIDLPLVQVPAKSVYTVTDIRSLVLNEVNLSGANSDRPGIYQKIPRAEPNSKTIGDSSESQEIAPSVSESTQPLCPKCSSPMLRKKSKTGANAGQEFWGCSAFPKCRSILPISAQPDV